MKEILRCLMHKILQISAKFSASLSEELLVSHLHKNVRKKTISFIDAEMNYICRLIQDADKHEIHSLMCELNDFRELKVYLSRGKDHRIPSLDKEIFF